MDQSVARKIVDIQDIVRKDPDSKPLLEKYRIRNDQLLAVLSTLPRTQQDVIMDYLGAGSALHLRLMELACTTR